VEKYYLQCVFSVKVLNLRVKWSVDVGPPTAYAHSPASLLLEPTALNIRPFVSMYDPALALTDLHCNNYVSIHLLWSQWIRPHVSTQVNSFPLICCIFVKCLGVDRYISEWINTKSVRDTMTTVQSHPSGSSEAILGIPTGHRLH